MKRNCIYETIKKVPFGQLIQYNTYKLRHMEASLYKEFFALQQAHKENSTAYRHNLLALEWVQSAIRIRKILLKKTKDIEKQPSKQKAVFVKLILDGDFDG